MNTLHNFDGGYGLTITDCLNLNTYKQYFPEDLFRISPNEVFIDCGAFDGDTLKNFLTESSEHFDCYIAFEPDPSNFSKLENAISKLDERLKSKILHLQISLK